MITATEREALEIIESGWIRVVDLPDGRTIPARLAGVHALRMLRPDLCRNGIPRDYDELLILAGQCGLGLESAELQP